MGRVLILGGTGWLGREIARAALREGAEVTCLARGQSGEVAEGARLVRADRLLPGAHDDVAGPWDDVVELAHDPALVGASLDALADHAAHWTLVSSVSVYADAATPLADESAELVEPVEPVDASRYAEAKVAAERATAARLGDRLLVVRPGLIAGPGDPSDRLGWWPARMHRGGRVVVPTTERRWVQAIDVADLADVVEEAGRTHRVGIVDAVGEALPLAAALAEVDAAAGSRSELVTVDDETLRAAGVSWWAGPRSLPLWLPTDAEGFARRSGAAWREAGGRRRPFRETVERVLADELARGRDRPRRAGLDAEAEAAVLALVDARPAPERRP